MLPLIFKNTTIESVETMHKDLVQFITEKYTSMTDSEKLLSDYIINHYDRVLSMSVQALAADTGLSVATVVRFAQHMGFDGYKEFRLHLAKVGRDDEDFILDFHKSENSIDAQISKMLTSCSDCLALTRQNLDYSTLTQIVEKINRAGTIALFGVGTSYTVCQDAAIKFKRIGIATDCACELHTASLILSGMKEGDVVFGISHSGNNEIIEKILKQSRKMHMTTVAVTTFQNSNICDMADHILYTQTRESPLHKIAITSRVSQFAMLDSLFMAYLTTYYDTCMEHIDRIYEVNDNLK